MGTFIDRGTKLTSDIVLMVSSEAVLTFLSFEQFCIQSLKSNRRN